MEHGYICCLLDEKLTQAFNSWTWFHKRAFLKIRCSENSPTMQGQCHPAYLVFLYSWSFLMPSSGVRMARASQRADVRGRMHLGTYCHMWLLVGRSIPDGAYHVPGPLGQNALCDELEGRQPAQVPRIEAPSPFYLALSNQFLIWDTRKGKEGACPKFEVASHTYWDKAIRKDLLTKQSV